MKLLRTTVINVERVDKQAGSRYSTVNKYTHTIISGVKIEQIKRLMWSGAQAGFFKGRNMRVFVIIEATKESNSKCVLMSIKK